MLYYLAYNFTHKLYLCVQPLVEVGFDVVVCELYVSIGTGIVCTVLIVNLTLHHLCHILNPISTTIFRDCLTSVCERVKTAVTVIVDNLK